MQILILTMNYQPLDSASCATLVELLRWRATAQPDRLAYTFLLDGERQEVHCSYADLDRQARAIAARLESIGAAGERALLLYPPGLDYIAAFFGCLYAGVVAVPAFPPRPNRPMPRLQTIVADGQVTVALTASGILENMESRFTHAPDLRSLCWLDTQQLPAALESEWREPAVTPGSLAFLQYTSGSTSSPKGVMLSHGNLMHNLRLIHRCFEGRADCHSVFWLPPYHDMGLIGGILEPLFWGSSATLMAPVAFLQRPFRWLDAISRTRAAVSGAPNFAYDLCVEKIPTEQRASLDLSHWSLAFNGAEPVRPETLDRFEAAFAPCGFRREAFYPCYGLAEATLLVSGGQKAALPVIQVVSGTALGNNQVQPAAARDPKARAFVGSGQSPPEQRLLIVDPETCLPCPPDRIGEIWVQGPSVAQGYWNRPAESAQTFAARLGDVDLGPFLRTGDLGFLKNGELFVTGRAKDLIILHGQNHYPHDIELTVEGNCSAVRRSCSAAFAVEGEGEERLVIVAEVERDSRKRNLDEVMSAIRQAVATHHDVPVWSIALIKTLTIPKTSSGKIQRHVCRERYVSKNFEIVAEWTQPAASAPRFTFDEEVNLAMAAEQVQSVAPSQPCSRCRVEGRPCARCGVVVQANDPCEQAAQGNRERQQKTRAIEAWLVARISERLKVPVPDMDVREPFARFGMDSMTAVMLAGDLELWLGRRLQTTLLYDYPSIQKLARHLAEEPDNLEPPSTPSSALGVEADLATPAFRNGAEKARPPHRRPAGAASADPTAPVVDRTVPHFLDH